MNDFEAQVHRLRRAGWFVKLHATVKGWECQLDCGVEMLPASIPRPSAVGDTANIALTLAVRQVGRLGLKVA